MTGKKAGKKPKQKQQQIVLVQPNAPRKAKGSKPKPKRGNGNDGMGWLRLLADPCNAPFAKPCYQGTDSGYMLRTTNYIPLVGTSTGLTPGSTILCSGGFYFSPSNLSETTGLAYGCTTSANATYSVTSAGITAFITDPIYIGGYRCVAACLKWVPSGPYAVRSGIVGLGYSQTPPVPVGGATVTPVTSLPNVASCQHSSTTGSEPHETRWIPTTADQNFTTLTAQNTQMAGTVYLALHNIDGTASSTTNYALNGYVEMVAVWEWIPMEVRNMQMNIQAPPRTSMNEVLSRISDMGRFISRGFGMGQTAARLLTAGVNVAQNARPAVPLLMM